mgnify:CR=1 FL=1
MIAMRRDCLGKHGEFSFIFSDSHVPIFAFIRELKTNNDEVQFLLLGGGDLCSTFNCRIFFF